MQFVDLPNELILEISTWLYADRSINAFLCATNQDLFPLLEKAWLQYDIKHQGRSFVAAVNGNKISLASKLVELGQNVDRPYCFHELAPSGIPFADSATNCTTPKVLVGDSVRLLEDHDITLLQCFAQIGRRDCVQWLLAYGANPEYDFHGRYSAIGLAIFNGWEDIAIDMISTLNHKPKSVVNYQLAAVEDVTPFELAVTFGTPKLLKYLINIGAVDDEELQEMIPIARRHASVRFIYHCLAGNPRLRYQRVLGILEGEHSTRLAILRAANASTGAIVGANAGNTNN